MYFCQSPLKRLPMLVIKVYQTLSDVTNLDDNNFRKLKFVLFKLKISAGLTKL